MNNQQQNWQQPQMTEQQMVQFRYQQQLQQQQMRQNQQRSIQQSNFRPPAQSPVATIKRPTEDVVHIKTVKQRLEEQLLKDHASISSLDNESFKSKQDVLDRLLPYHVYQIVEIDHSKYDKLDQHDVLEKAKLAVSKAVSVMQQQDEFYVNFNRQRADQICQQKGRK